MHIRFQYPISGQTHISAHVPQAYGGYLHPFGEATFYQAPGVSWIDQVREIKGCVIVTHTFFVQQPVTLTTVVEQDFSTLHCVLQGSVQSLLDGKEVWLQQGQLAIFRVNTGRHLVLFEPGIFVSLHIDLSWELQLELASSSRFVRQLLTLAGEHAAALITPAPGVISEKLYTLIDEIRSSRGKGDAEELWLYAKLIEILTLSLRILEPAEQATAKDADEIVYHTIRAVLERNLATPPAMAELTRLYAITESRLRRGFRRYFGQTVSAYVKQRRMERARELLLIPGKKIAEVAYEMGYNQPSNFTREYKKYFGYPPREHP